MSTNGILDFQNTNKVIFRGTDSNVVVDTSNASIGIGIQGTEKPGSNLHVIGDASISSNLKLTTDTSITVNSNVVTDFNGPHAREPKEVPLKKYPEIAFDASKVDTFANSNAYTQAGYEISSTSRFSPSYDVLSAFNGTHQIDHFASQSPAYSLTPPYNYTLFTNNVTDKDSTQYTGEEIKVKMPQKIKLSKVHIVSYVGASGRKAASGHIFGSNTGANGSWTKLADFSSLNTGTSGHETVSISTTEYYEWYSLVVTNLNGSEGLLNIYELEYYGYEEDPPAGDISVDTTFTSIMNTPQTTGANVYVDGNLGETFTNRVTGPTPTGTETTYDQTGKYWELTGELTSNVTVEANTFLEGDQPHAVSVWFNSSNLEANVSNTCVFSISDQEKLDSVNLDLQSNTWHNLTYSYQGEGGSRVTYLDGRKVAEEPAEDTFGDYPPFAMTGYSQGGYVVSVSSTHLESVYRPFYAFNDIITDVNHIWHSDTSSYTGASYQYDGIERLAANVDPGDWIKLETPHKIKVSYINITARPPDAVAGNLENQAPTDFQVCGSNDDVNWDVLASFTGEAPQDDGSSYYIVNAQRGYKYLAIAVNRTVGSTSLTISNISYYGHRENDLVRLPDPTNVLKYPHIAMTGPAQRGYVVTASSEYSNYLSWYAFDDQSEYVNNNKWVSQQNVYQNSSSYSGSNRLSSDKGGPASGIGSTVQGEWLAIELPNKIKVQSTKLVSYANTSEEPENFIIYGSNDNVNWVIVDDTYQNTSANIPIDLVGKIWTVSTAGSSVAYKYFGIAVTKIGGGTSVVAIKAWELYGTGVDSIPIQIGGGNIDKVANFRVYDKFIDENQALEIWDAQKDTFREVKNSMTLHKGRLGIGTTEPEGSLAVLDEPHNLEEFPPRAMSDDKTYIEGHGEFCTNASNIYTNSYAYKAFNKIQSGSGMNLHWSQHDMAGVPTYDNTTGEFTGSTDSRYLTNVDGLNVNGHWIQIEFPYKINYRYSEIQGPDHAAGRQPHTGYIVGSNDLSGMWTSLHNYSGMTRTGVRDFVTYTPPTVSTQTFKYIRLVIEKLGGGNIHAGVSQWRIFGTREQGQSVLHDGQLTLTKSLTVPRIGPALDADDTPRRDRLVVEYNTSTNPTFEGAVRDTSGRGNDGMFNGTASYDALEKSLTSSGTTGEIRIGNLPTTTITQLSLSFWIHTSGNGPLFYHGYEATGRRISFSVDTGGTGLFFAISSNYIQNTTCLTVGEWQHVSVVFLGGSIGTSLSDGSSVYKLYINGVDEGWTGGLFNGGTLQLENGHPLVLMNGLDGTSGTGNIKLSNFKYYNTALTASEVKTLYDMGRCDEGHHVVNFSKTRVGIGLGDGEAPRSTLDVRGGIAIGNTTGQVGPLHIKFSTDAARNSGTRFEDASSTNYWENWINNGDYFYFAYNGSDRGYIQGPGGAGATQMPNFTGQHMTFIKDISFIQAGELEGLIVSSDQNKYIKMSGGIEAGSNAITTNESLPIVSLSNVVTDKKCFGVISASEDPETRTVLYGAWGSVAEKEKGDTRVYINSVGEGAIWVVNTNGSLESGDYITTSNVAGYGQKQDSAGLMNYTVAKITMDCDFEPATQPIQIIKKDEEGENILDEHEQIQWEDHPTDTEKAYKIRYLDAQGAQTDEANAVHIAAFVGCTYHCG